MDFRKPKLELSADVMKQTAEKILQAFEAE